MTDISSHLVTEYSMGSKCAARMVHSPVNSSQRSSDDGATVGSQAETVLSVKLSIPTDRIHYPVDNESCDECYVVELCFPRLELLSVISLTSPGEQIRWERRGRDSIFVSEMCRNTLANAVHINMDYDGDISNAVVQQSIVEMKVSNSAGTSITCLHKPLSELIVREPAVAEVGSASESIRRTTTSVGAALDSTVLIHKQSGSRPNQPSMCSSEHAHDCGARPDAPDAQCVEFGYAQVQQEEPNNAQIIPRPEPSAELLKNLALRLKGIFSPYSASAPKERLWEGFRPVLALYSDTPDAYKSLFLRLMYPSPHNEVTRPVYNAWLTWFAEPRTWVNKLEVVQRIAQQSYFHGFLSGPDARCLLLDKCVVGSFLVRLPAGRGIAWHVVLSVVVPLVLNGEEYVDVKECLLELKPDGSIATGEGASDAQIVAGMYPSFGAFMLHNPSLLYGYKRAESAT